MVKELDFEPIDKAERNRTYARDKYQNDPVTRERVKEQARNRAKIKRKEISIKRRLKRQLDPEFRERERLRDNENRRKRRQLQRTRDLGNEN